MSALFFAEAIGPGPDRIAIHQVARTISTLHLFWIQVEGSAFYRPHWSPMPGQQRLDEFYFHGRFFAIHCAALKQGPLPISPWVLAALFLADSESFTIPRNLLLSLDPGVLKHLDPWYEWLPTDPFPNHQQPAHPLRLFVIDRWDMEPSLMPSVRTPEEHAQWVRRAFATILLGAPDAFQKPEFLALKDGLNVPMVDGGTTFLETIHNLPPPQPLIGNPLALAVGLCDLRIRKPTDLIRLLRFRLHDEDEDDGERSNDPAVSVFLAILKLRVDRYLCQPGHPPEFANVLEDHEFTAPAKDVNFRANLLLHTASANDLLPADSSQLIWFDLHTHVQTQASERPMEVHTCYYTCDVFLDAALERVLLQPDDGSDSLFKYWLHGRNRVPTVRADEEISYAHRATANSLPAIQESITSNSDSELPSPRTLTATLFGAPTAEQPDNVGPVITAPVSEPAREAPIEAQSTSFEVEEEEEQSDTGELSLNELIARVYVLRGKPNAWVSASTGVASNPAAAADAIQTDSGPVDIMEQDMPLDIMEVEMEELPSLWFIVVHALDSEDRKRETFTVYFDGNGINSTTLHRLGQVPDLARFGRYLRALRTVPSALIGTADIPLPAEQNYLVHSARPREIGTLRDVETPGSTLLEKALQPAPPSRQRTHELSQQGLGAETPVFIVHIYDENVTPTPIYQQPANAPAAVALPSAIHPAPSPLDAIQVALRNEFNELFRRLDQVIAWNGVAVYRKWCIVKLVTAIAIAMGFRFPLRGQERSARVSFQGHNVLFRQVVEAAGQTYSTFKGWRSEYEEIERAYAVLDEYVAGELSGRWDQHPTRHVHLVLRTAQLEVMMEEGELDLQAIEEDSDEAVIVELRNWSGWVEDTKADAESAREASAGMQENGSSDYEMEGAEEA
ncbi:hypothetical protein C8F01DRAFT_1318826 [Mycena amicta]|nr:hypothetical protein C8F01DRAFT_1318826 [Mycena amicta]